MTMTWTIMRIDGRVTALPLEEAKAKEAQKPIARLMWPVWDTQKDAQHWADTLNQVTGGTR